MTSPFLTPPPKSESEKLAILHLRRDSLIATKLKQHDDDDEGYDEGKVTNTRFGSFPHSTLIDVPWGAQIRASAVDTGSRGRRKPEDSRSGNILKRKAALEDGGRTEGNGNGNGNGSGVGSGSGNVGAATPKVPMAASSGFLHLLPPTPENWTASLPHRTQVVYTPDYSYILQRLRVRPGKVIIEAGAGSGSFTHAAARAVFSGYGNSEPQKKEEEEEEEGHARKKRKLGQVFSFEFHEQRVAKLRNEIHEHGLNKIVHITHRDVYNDGFLYYGQREDCSEDKDKEPAGPNASAVFLDLPAPWLALKHLKRAKRKPDPPSRDSSPELETNTQNTRADQKKKLPTPRPNFSPLDPTQTIHICTFSPCIEQVQKTVAELRNQGWLEIEMVEIAQRRIEVRRERVGLHEEGLRGVNATAATVDEAVARLKEVQAKTIEFHEQANANASGGNVISGTGKKGNIEARKEREEGRRGDDNDDDDDDDDDDSGQDEEMIIDKDENETNVDGPTTSSSTPQTSKQKRVAKIKESLADRKTFKEGRLVHRSESELKTHTSYLVFAVLPREWSEEDEEACQQRWPPRVDLGLKDRPPKSIRQIKREAKRKAEEREARAAGTSGPGEISMEMSGGNEMED